MAEKHPPVVCELCPNECILEYLERGDCRVRYNAGNGVLKTLVYGKPCAVHVDPVEKKPMYHFLPGTRIFSIATAGCNLHCRNCQNWEISQAYPEDVEVLDFEPKKVVAAAKYYRCPSIAYTYTEPVVYYEYTYDTSVLAKKEGLYNIWVTAGYINEKPLKEILPYLDGANVDLKAFSDEFYQKVCAGTLKPVLRTLELFAEAGKILEITNLVIPTLNDDFDMIKRMCKWILENLGPDIPLHFSRFWPQYQLRYLPPTPAATLERAAEIAYEVGLHFVYVGNIRHPKYENTYCPHCGKAVIKRRGYEILEYHLNGDKCEFCGKKIWGKWLPEGVKP